MIWINRIILLIIVFEFAGCSRLENLEGGNTESDDASAEYITTPELTPIWALGAEEPSTTGQNIAYRRSDFILGKETPSASAIRDNPDQVCSPLASVPLGELSTIVSDPYKPPPKGSDARHQGTDYAYYRRYSRASIAGEEVQSVFWGKIASVVKNKFPYGNALIIETPYNRLSKEIREKFGIKIGQSLYTLYAHLESFSRQEIGEEVSSCQPIGVVGKSGNAGVEHLHLEMRIGPSNQVIPSMGYYVPESTPAERKTYILWRTSGVFNHFDPMKLLDIKS